MKLYEGSSNMDERTRGTIRSVASKLYFVTLQVLILDILYRQIVLKQNSSEFEDLAIIVTFNAIVFLVAVLWKGGVSFKKVSLSAIGFTYLAILLLGSLLGVLLDRFDSWAEYGSYITAVGGVSAILLGIYVTTAMMANRRLDRMTSDDSTDGEEAT